MNQSPHAGRVQNVRKDRGLKAMKRSEEKQIMEYASRKEKEELIEKIMYWGGSINLPLIEHPSIRDTRNQ